MSDLKLLRKFHRLLMPFLGVFFVSILFDIVSTLLGLATPLFTRVLFDYAYPMRDLALLNKTIFAIIGLYFSLFFIEVLSDYLQTYIGQEATARLSEKAFHSIQCLPVRFHQEKKLGDLIIRITEDVESVVGIVSNILPTIIIDGGRFVIVLIIALSINVELTLLALLSVPLYIIEAKFYAGKHARVQGEAIDAHSNIFSRASERLGSIKTIKAFGQERRETLSFAKLVRRQYRVAIKGRLLEIIQTFTNSITLQMWSIFLTWFLGYQVILGNLSIGEIVALMLYMDQLEGPIHAFIGLFTDWKTNAISMRRVEEVLEHPNEEDLHPGTEDLDVSKGDVEAEKLSFEYVSDTPVLTDVDMEFHPNSITAIVGASGSGKTTIVNLLLRFFDPTKGMILVDGQNISEVRIHGLRRKVGIVAQEATLFDGTVMDNILYGNEGMERGDAMRAAQQAGAHDFITRLPGGYDAPVGMGGELLSGGQRQRIAIARTLLRNPAVILFDEATSALDAESEFRIQGVITKLKNTKTIIVIAHRLSTIKMADKVMVLDNGRFIEEGKFEDLYERKGAFYKFYWRQFGGLATVRQQLGTELERSSRYGSKFCLAIMKVFKYDSIKDSDGVEAADRFTEAVDMRLKRLLRMGDNCAILDGGTILVLLPEIDEEHLSSFFGRMLKDLPGPAGEEMESDLDADDLAFVGTLITEKIFKTPEELMAALKKEADARGTTPGTVVIEAKELSKRERG